MRFDVPLGHNFLDAFLFRLPEFMATNPDPAKATCIRTTTTQTRRSSQPRHQATRTPQ
jgi:hypothetical protein